jgi:hypothetical protein
MMAARKNTTVDTTDDSLWWNPDISTWDEDVFRWCQETGFNPFGSGPTPIFVKETEKS